MRGERPDRESRSCVHFYQFLSAQVLISLSVDEGSGWVMAARSFLPLAAKYIFVFNCASGVTSGSVQDISGIS
jgi:hypothetical protein